MGKPESWRLIPASYPILLDVQTRFQDLDPNGHLNNVAFAALFEHGRVRLNRDVRPMGERGVQQGHAVPLVGAGPIAHGTWSRGWSGSKGRA